MTRRNVDGADTLGPFFTVRKERNSEKSQKTLPGEAVSWVDSLRSRLGAVLSAIPRLQSV